MFKGLPTLAAPILLGILGGLLLAVARESPDARMLGWVSVVPLLIAVRAFRPSHALLTGGTWGLSLCIFSTTTIEARGWPSLELILLVSTAPAIYAYVGARLTRWIGFSPLILGVGWIGVELTLTPLGMPLGLLGGTQSGGALIPWIGGALGYVLVAFVVAYVSAIVLSTATHLCSAWHWLHRRVAAPNRGTAIAPQTFSCFPLFAIPSTHPRGPPVRPTRFHELAVV